MNRRAVQPPLDLGVVASVDPFTVQPGVKLFRRFCVLGQVRHSADSWRVEVTDWEERLGAPPHHRLMMHVLPAEGGSERILRAALPAHGTRSARIEAVVSMSDAFCILTPHSSGRPAQLPMSQHDAVSVARTLARLLARLHAVGVANVRFDLRDIRLDLAGELQFASVHHLIALRAAEPGHPDHEADVHALLELLRSLDQPAIRDALAEIPPVAEAVADRLDALPRGRARVSAVDALPAVPPFVGREVPLRRVAEAGARVRHSGVEIYAVTGDPGAGRTRLLHQLAIELARGRSHVVVQARFRPDAPHMGLSVLLDAIADALDQTYGAERDAIVRRIHQGVEVDLGLLTDASPRLRALLGPAVSAPPTTLDERQIRYGAAVADLLGAIATPDRPVALLLDDLEHTDASIRSALYQLAIPTRADPILVVLTHRPGTEVSLPRRVVPLEIGPLPLEAVRSMLAAALPGRLEEEAAIAARLFAASAGAPESTWQLLRRWIELGVMARNERNAWTLADSATTEPDGVVYLTRPWADLSDAARGIAGLAVIQSEAVEPGWLGGVTGWSSAAVRDAAGELVRASLLYQDDGGRLHFTSDSARETAQRALGDDELRAAHRQVARWLQGLDRASPSQRAWHEEHAADPGIDEGLAQLHVRAGQLHLAQCDARRALWHFERSVARTRQPEVLAAAHEGRADALLLLDRNREALQSYLELYDSVTDPLQALRTASRVVNAFYLFGDEEAALTVADRALRIAGYPLPTSGWRAVLEVAKAALRIAGGRRMDPARGDAIANLHCWLVATVAPRYPHVGLLSLFRALAASNRRSSAATACARAYFSVVFASAELKRAMHRMLRRAEDDARRAGDGVALGIVEHFRGLNELTLGAYESGQSALDRAVRAYRRAGDLSLTGAALTAVAQFSMDREALPVLRERIATAISTAWRNRHRAVLPMLHGMELLARARRTPLADEKLGSMFDFVDDRSTDYFTIAGRAYVSLALLRSGLVARALAISAQAYEQFRACTAPSPFLAVALVAHAEALIASGDDLAQARRVVRELEARARSIRSVRNAAILTKARLAVRTGRCGAARRLLRMVIETAAVHKELWHVRDAHLLMAQILAWENVNAAEAHASLAAELAQTLGIHADRTTATPAPPRSATRSTPTDVALWNLVDGLAPALEQALPRGVTLSLRSAAGIRVVGTPEDVELLVVNLVLAARDAVEAPAAITVRIDEVELPYEEAARAITRRPGRWSRITVHVDRAARPGAGALSECRALCNECGGFLEVAEDADGLALCASLPAPDGIPVRASQLVAVVHSDERVRAALIEGIRRLGWSAASVPIGEQLPSDAIAVFAERGCTELLPDSVEVVEVIRRGDPRGDVLTLRTPFLVGELEQVLAALEARHVR